jgi:hypothetical protein
LLRIVILWIEWRKRITVPWPTKGTTFGLKNKRKKQPKYE